jgi:exopolyphosphatase/pppGpp-phosphohydrolase
LACTLNVSMTASAVRAGGLVLLSAGSEVESSLTAGAAQYGIQELELAGLHYLDAQTTCTLARARMRNIYRNNAHVNAITETKSCTDLCMLHWCSATWSQPSSSLADRVRVRVREGVGHQHREEQGYRDSNGQRPSLRRAGGSWRARLISGASAPRLVDGILRVLWLMRNGPGR